MMYSINYENVKDMEELLKTNRTVMYGAGGNGERILKVLKDYNIRIDEFCDDDYNKWGTTFCGIPVISYNDLVNFSKGSTVNVILTSVFGGPILGKLENMDVRIYEAFSILIDKYYRNSFYKMPLTKEEKKGIMNQIEKVKALINDEESSEILEKIKQTISKPDERDYSRFFSVASKEDCYFVNEVLKSLPPHPVIVDCGGFTGDLMVPLKRHGIDFAKVFSFEVNKKLFQEMKENISSNHLEHIFIPINKGVWDTEGISYLNVSENDIAGGRLRDDSPTGIEIETVTIDHFFQDIPYDFIKMDIEGAEKNALMGGNQTILKYRPIMAISLYHSVHDVVDIPLYLASRLNGYNFFVRHHSFIDSETVLYCIPKEKWSI